MFPTIGCFPNSEPFVYWIAEQDAEARWMHPQAVEEAFRRIRIREHQLPRLAAIGGLIQPRQVAFARGHDYRRVRVEGLDAAEVQMLGAGRDDAVLPQVAAVLGAQDRAIRARSPRHPSAHIVDAAQIGPGGGILERPLGACATGCNSQQSKEQNEPAHTASV
jgi:hypothetical protein